MNPDFSTIKTKFIIDENSAITNTTVNNGDFGSRSLRTYRIKVRVNGPQEEMAEYLRFTKELNELRLKESLTVDKDDPLSYPSFIIHYPKKDKDGSYFIIKNYTVFLDI